MKELPLIKSMETKKVLKKAILTNRAMLKNNKFYP